jgi:hypothetical protein
MCTICFRIAHLRSHAAGIITSNIYVYRGYFYLPKERKPRQEKCILIKNNRWLPLRRAARKNQLHHCEERRVFQKKNRFHSTYSSLGLGDASRALEVEGYQPAHFQSHQNLITLVKWTVGFHGSATSAKKKAISSPE